MLCMTHVTLATVKELFNYKSQNFTLEEFPGYTPDQWGIKAHNRPWIEEHGEFKAGQKIIECGGAYSLLPKYLVDKYNLEAWVGDDFGLNSGDEIWSRWGDPRQLPQRYPMVKYVFENFGTNSPYYPDHYFDRIFTVSTLEHIPRASHLAVLKDMHRCLSKGGIELHTIDIPIATPWRVVGLAIEDKITSLFPPLIGVAKSRISDIQYWINVFKSSGVKVGSSIPNSIQLLDRKILVESPDVVYRFYPPNNAVKDYAPRASLSILIKDL